MTPRYHAPPPGSRSGVADYAETLQRALEAFGQLPCDLYHLGNNRLHETIYRHALETPGVIVLHDAVLHHFMLGMLEREEYIAEFVYNYGEWRRSQAEELWQERGNSGVDPRYFRFPMLRRVVERSRAVIVHNPGAAAIARSHGAIAIHVIPHFFELTRVPDAAEALRFRERIGVEPDVTLFGVFGYLRETKRVIPSIDAFRRLHAARPRTALLIEGEPASKDLARLLDLEAADPGIRRLGHLEEPDFTTAMGAIDCCINLRYPAAGETSGIAIRMMGAGKPVIVTDCEENADIPATACLRVTPGVAEAAELFDHMSLVTDFPPIAAEVRQQAARHIREQHSLETAARRYWEVLCASASV